MVGLRPHDPLGGGVRLGRAGREPRGEPARLVEQFVARKHTVNHTPIVQGFGGEEAAGHDELTGARRARSLGHPLRPTHQRGDPNDRLDEAEEAFAGWSEIYPSEEFDDFTAGTWSEERQYQSSLVADGLVSCVQRFDRLDEERGRALVFATDGEQRGRSVYDLPEAAAYAAARESVVPENGGAHSVDDGVS